MKKNGGGYSPSGYIKNTTLAPKSQGTEMESQSVSEPVEIPLLRILSLDLYPIVNWIIWFYYI